MYLYFIDKIYTMVMISVIKQLGRSSCLKKMAPKVFLSHCYKWNYFDINMFEYFY